MQIESCPQKPPDPGGETAVCARHLNSGQRMCNDGGAQKRGTDMPRVSSGWRDDEVARKGFEEKPKKIHQVSNGFPGKWLGRSEGNMI